MFAFVILCFALAVAILYFLPYIVAKARRHRQVTAIGVLNLLLGWTVLGWVGALVWAFVISEAPRD